MLSALVATLILALAMRPVRAQVPANCSYDACALSIIPRLSGLDVVRGRNEQRVGTLGFLLPRGVTESFDGSASAQTHARRALAIRRVAAVLTDAGGAIAVAAAIHAASTRENRRMSAYVSFGGLALIGVSVLPQFAADAELSRAVYEYNRQFSR